MRRFICFGVLVLLISRLAWSDYAMIYKRNGETYMGQWLGADGSSVRIRTQNDEQIRIPTDQIQAVEFLSSRGVEPTYRAFKLYQNGLEFLKLGMPDEAEKQFIASIREMPKYPDPYYEMAKLLENRGKVEEAFRYYGLVATLAPDRYDMADKFKMMAEKYLSEQQLDKAAEALYKLYSCFPASPDAEDAVYKAGFLFAEQLDQPEKAVQALRSAIQSFPDNPQSERAKFEICRLLMKLSRYQEALDATTDFITQLPNSPLIYDAHFIRGQIYHEMRMHQEAIDEFNFVRNNASDARLIADASMMISNSAWEIYRISDGLSANQIQALALDGNFLWVGTSKGLDRFDISDINQIRIVDSPDLKGENIRALAVNDRELWVGTLNTGVIRIDKQSGEKRIYNQLDGLPSKHIADVEVFGDEVWVATFGGVARLDRESNIWTRYTTEQGLSGNDTVAISITSDAVWVATSMNGVNRYDKSSDTWTVFTTDNGLPSNSIRSILASGNDVWVGWHQLNRRNGYGKYDPIENLWRATTLMTDNIAPAEDIYLALNGAEFWVATDAGAFVQVQLGDWNSWDSIEYPQAFADTRISCLVVSGSVAWFGSDKGLGKLDYGMLKQLRGNE